MPGIRPQLLAIHTTLICGTFIGAVDALREGSGFDRDACYNRTREWLAAGNRSNAEFFSRNPSTGAFLDGPNDTALTIAGCQNFCGKGTWYWDAGPRVTTWIIPVLLLLSNIELSPIDKRRFMTIVHALGDPIDSLWSMIHKIYTWHRLYEIGLSKCLPDVRTGFRDEHRARIIATVLAGFEEISGAWITDEGHYHMICRQLGKLGERDEDEAKFREWHKTARELADSRTNEFLRTALAIIVYGFGLISAFQPDVGGGNTTPPGGRIACAIFMSWLVPAALLSNTIGAYSSRRTCLDIMSHFIVAAGPRPVQGGNNNNNHMVVANTVADSITPTRIDGNNHKSATIAAGTSAERLLGDTEASGAVRTTNGGNDIPMNTYRRSRNGSKSYYDKMALVGTDSWEVYFNSMQWLGSIYTYRPWKGLHLGYNHPSHPRSRNFLMLLGAFLPVLVSALGAFIILYYAIPKGFSCRHVWVIAVFVCWIFSVGYTWVLYFFVQGAAHWWAVLIKDGIIGGANLLMVIFSTVGLFNNCYCWSAAMTFGAAASVPLVTDQPYEDNGKHIYQFVVMSCMLVHLVFFVTILTWWHKGVKLVRWSEKDRRGEWTYSMGEKLKYTPENHLIFWVFKGEAGM
ncbi:hypothetical protein H2198_003070 [Neophaeococcomyces mojaviensis]|uniref:Uncharacterized protein n=1 Tax=Neophaeococcomyces mojaviensis TaxID=3383035 RepID=A0ACC3ACT1_9EURO|nr:hypothetical protein H2198_003070 [Knufia sp. JES_112]